MFATGLPPAAHSLHMSYDDFAQQIADSERKSRKQTDIVFGSILLGVGLLITLGTYDAAASSSSGGTYIIAYGPMIVGAIRLFRGLAS